MKYIKQIYRTNNNITVQNLIERYNFLRLNNEIIYRFPVYKYGNKPLIFCEFVYDNEEKHLYVRVFDTNNNSYSFNKEYYGESNVISAINNKIYEKINEFVKNGIIKK